MFLSKIIETNVGDYIYDAVNNKIIHLPGDLSCEMKSGVFSEQYSEFINRNGLRDFRNPMEFSILRYKPYSDDEFKKVLNRSVNSITLCVTENCNLRCEYCCYMEKYLDSNYKLKNMTKEVAFKAIDFLMGNSSDSNVAYVSFYGGEPFLRFDLIKSCVEYCKEKYPFKIPSYNLTTNGLLFENDDIVEFVIRNKFHMLVSIDGTKRSHDEHRKDLFNKPSFDKVFKNLVKIYKKDPSFFKRSIGISAVTTSINRCKSQYAFWDMICKSNINFATSKLTEPFKKILNEKLQSHLQDQIDETEFEFFKENILESMKIYHEGLNNEIETTEVCPGGFCIPGIRRNFVTPEGQIIVCERVDERNETFTIGDIYNGIDLDKLNKLLDITFEKSQKCKSCWAAKLASFCFKDIVDSSAEYCKECSQEVYAGIKYYIEEVKDKREIITYLENMSIE
ncbi:MAG: radical SAM protein [Clostridia bacterium]|nr:radical SAM protein [Clostridia bacterium]